jgi:ferredoxin-NADP reductase
MIKYIKKQILKVHYSIIERVKKIIAWFKPSPISVGIKSKLTKNVQTVSFPDYNDDDILCHCMMIKRSEITPLLKRSNKNMSMNDLIGCSGAGSVCTGCHPLLLEMLGNEIWTPVKIISIENASEYAKTFRFESKGKAFHPAKAGQHIIVQAYIDGIWELRRYTLTTAAEETAYREITVQRELSGKFSNWLHKISESEILIKISQPAGEVTPDLVSIKPLICLVGGIGITPVISFIRTIQNKVGHSHQLIIDYSASNNGRLVYKDELQELVKLNHNININFRLTKEDGLINQNDIDKLVKQYPDSEFYVCGPPTYSDAILNYLSVAKIDNSLINIEIFSVPEQNKVNQSKTYFYLGMTLFVAFLAQYLFEWKMPWLQNLQTQEPYKIYSGLLLAFYILTQFIMSYNNMCEKPHVSAYKYQQHKFRGAFAPLIFFIHSTQFGVGYLLMLSMIYFSNFLLGIFNHERIKNPINRIRYFKLWLPLHIVLSLLLIALVGFHIYVVASY